MHILKYYTSPSSDKAIERNHKLLVIFFLYTTFHGVLRKWVFSGNTSINNTLFFLQLISPYVFYYFYARVAVRNKLFKIINIYTLVLIGLALNPLNATIYHGIFGIVLHLGLWLLMFIYISDPESIPIERLSKLFLVVSLIQIGLAFVQFNLPFDSFLNKYDRANKGEIVALQGVFVRVSGTFSYISGYGSFMFFYGALMWYFIKTKYVPNILSLLLVILGLFGSFINGGRSVVALYLLMVLFAYLSVGDFKQTLSLAISVFMVLFLTYFYNLTSKIPVINDSFGAFSGRVNYGNNSGETDNRTITPIQEIINFRGNYPLFGTGLGATYQGATALWGKSSYIQEYEGGYEEEPERILLEGGYFLFFIRFILFLILIRNLSIPVVYSLPIVFCIVFYIPTTFNVYQTVFTFFSFALIDKAYRHNKIKT